MKKTFGYIATIALVILLAGCGNSTDNTGKSASKTDSAKLNSKRDEPEVKKGPLLKSGQWTDDDDIGKITLLKIAAPNTPNAKDGVSYTLKDVKLFKVIAAKESQIKAAKDAFGENVENSYYYLQISFNMKNSTNSPLEFIGVKNIVLSDGSQIDPHIPTANSVSPSANKDAVSPIFIPSDKIHKTNKITINFDSVFSENSDDVNIEDFPAMDVELK